jgi:hypothetical protein
MPNPTVDRLLTSLESSKSRFGPGDATETCRLLDQLSRRRFHEPKSLIRFHEALLFFRAFPLAPSIIPRVEKLLNTFHQRIERLRRLDVDMSAFDDLDTSGIAGTIMQDTLSFEVARWLVRRIPRHVEIAWDDYWDDFNAERAMSATLPRLIPLLEEDAAVEANIPWTRWLDAARGHQRPLDWLIRRFEQLPVTDRERAQLYDSLRLPIRWNLGNLRFSRTRNWGRPRRFFYHTQPLIARSQVSLAHELAKPAPALTRLSRSDGEAIMHTVREVMAVRYRELYGTTLGDPSSVVRADLGADNASRGVVLHLWNLPPHRRLPLRTYVAGFTLKNGVPINYVEAIGLCEWIEVGFNTFYTFRHGETAWIYAQALRCLRAFTAATTISVYPYQIGQNNDEAIDSGAFWFYRKLGFRSGRPDLERLAKREEQKIAANPQHRTSRRTLKRLAQAHVFYDFPLHPRPARDRLASADAESFVSGHAFRRADHVANSSAALAAAEHPGPWDAFSTRTLGLRINRRMAQEFSGDNQKLRAASVKQVARALGINPSRWTPAERNAFENWSLVLALIPDLTRWSKPEKLDMTRIIRAQAGAHEMHYLRLTQQHLRLRRELLRLGSDQNQSGKISSTNPGTQ